MVGPPAPPLNPSHSSWGHCSFQTLIIIINSSEEPVDQHLRVASLAPVSQLISTCHPLDQHLSSDAIQPSHPLSSLSPPVSVFPSIRVLFKCVGSSHQVVRVLELQLQHQPFQWICGLISLRIDWFDLLAVQGTLKGLFQHHSFKASVCPILLLK